jgi:hexosaminidase
MRRHFTWTSSLRLNLWSSAHRFQQSGGVAERAYGHILAADEPLAFLDSMYRRGWPVFTTSIYNVGCDETLERGQGRSAERGAQESCGQVYVDNLVRLADIVCPNDKSVML